MLLNLTFTFIDLVSYLDEVLKGILLIHMDKPLLVSALIVTRLNQLGVTEILNVLASNKDRYGFPGGKLEERETPLESVIRETEEELGHKPTSVEYIGEFEALTSEGRQIKMYVFTGRVAEDIQPTNEIAELHWLTFEEMNTNRDVLTPMTIEHILPLLASM